MKCLLVDFDDSFTLNIASFLYDKSISVEVVHWSELEKMDFSFYSCVILGPGPGNPEEYSSINHIIKNLIQNFDIYLMGICLGHQLIHLVLGHVVTEIPFPKHGQIESLVVPKWPIFPEKSHGKKTSVQLYNSLGVRNFETRSDLSHWINKGVIWATLGESFVSYQFHPESVGTSCPELFFAPILNIFYNKDDEETSKDQRHLRLNDSPENIRPRLEPRWY